jgi:hypothetical protein
MVDNQRIELVLLPPDDPFFTVRGRCYSVKKKGYGGKYCGELGCRHLIKKMKIVIYMF